MAKKRFIIPKERLEMFYLKRRLSIFKIAKIFNCTAGVIVCRMKEYKIKRRHPGPKRVKVSKRALNSLYVQRGLSSRQIAKICHCEQSAILNKLRKYGVLVRRPKESIGIAKKDLARLYINKKLSTYKIANIYNCSSGTVYRYLQLYKVKTRPLKRIHLSKKELKILYFDKRLPLSKIAKIYKCCPVAIFDKMKKYQIPRRSFSETSTRYPKRDFDGGLKERAYMIGFRIGDLRVRKNKNLIGVGCGTTKLDQISLIKDLFNAYGPIWVGKKDRRGAVHVECSLNKSFIFLLPKHIKIPKWIMMSKSNFLNFLAGYTDAEGNIAISQNRARFRIRSYDKGILQDIHRNLHKMSIRSLFKLDKKAGVDKRGIFRRQDTWAVIVNERASLLKLFNHLEPLLRHKKRKKDLFMGLKNVVLRLNN